MILPGPLRRGAGAKAAGDILKDLLRRKKFYQKGRHSSLASAWAELVGTSIAHQSRVRAFEGGQLTVEVYSPALLHELNGFMKSQLLCGLQGSEAGRDVVRIKFRLGNAAAVSGRDETRRK